MPCHAARARELVRDGRAIKRFNRGLFYIRFLDRAEGEIQPVAIGVDPGSKKEAITVKSSKHTFLNMQLDAVTWVKDAEETSTMLRRSRRNRKTPCRKPKVNRARGGIPPSIKARWGWKLNAMKRLARIYPLSVIVVEDIAAKSKEGQRKWNRSFSPLEVGKNWFYSELEKIAAVQTVKGWETKALRDVMGLKKSKSKMSTKFEAHCVDSWVLANSAVDGHSAIDNMDMIYVAPIRLHRRQLHALRPSKDSVRRPYGGTQSLCLKRGTWVNHSKYGTCYVGGTSKGRISLHEMEVGKRLCQNAKVEDCSVLTRASWRLWHEKEFAANSSHA